MKKSLDCPGGNKARAHACYFVSKTKTTALISIEKNMNRKWDQLKIAQLVVCELSRLEVVLVVIIQSSLKDEFK